MDTIHNSHQDPHPNGANHSHAFHYDRRGVDPNVTAGQAANRISLLDKAAERVKSAAADTVLLHQTLDEMITMFRDVKKTSTPVEWEEWKTVCRRHPLTDLLHEDPFTRRAFVKPRGYAGDAELLDFIYGREEMWPAPEASSLGQQIFAYTTNSPAPEGVRARRAFIAKMIDRIADENPYPAVLSIAAGHLREALLSAAIKRRRVGRMLAFDADPLSMELVEREYGCFGVETRAASIRRLFTNKLNLGTFDLAYSTGLFDYLSVASSRRLVTIMFNMLNSGGHLLVANFLPGVRDVGYMEVFMDWNLIFRTRHQMIELTMEIPQEEIRGIRVFAEESQNIIFLEVIKN